MGVRGKQKQMSSKVAPPAAAPQRPPAAAAAASGSVAPSAAAALVAAEAEADATVNFTFINSVYAFFSIVSLVLYALDANGISGETLKGFWIIFAPALPALVISILKSSLSPAIPRPKQD